MKALFISYNMTLTERVEGLLDHYTVRGFTLFPLTHGRGLSTVSLTWARIRGRP